MSSPEELDMFKTGILVLTTSILKRSGTFTPLLNKAKTSVEGTLYIYLEPDTNGGENYVPLTMGVRDLILQSYAKAASVPLDVRFLLQNIGQKCEKLNTIQQPSIAVCDRNLDISNLLGQRFSLERDLIKAEVNVTENDLDAKYDSKETIKTYDNVILGGTFDRLHNGHKILLSQAAMICNKKLTIGVTHGKMNEKKSLHELMQSTEERINAVRDFLDDVKPSIHNDVVQITDPFGPTITDENYECIVVSQETLRGGNMVNTERQKKGWHPLEMVVIDLVEDEDHAPEEETKISSSSGRKRLLGSLLKPSVTNPLSPISPDAYVIGLTGGIASGKSSVCKRLEKLGAAIVDCDKLGHIAYVKGTKTFDKIVEEFGADIVKPDGEIHRRALGAKVFSDKALLEKLNQIVWPAIEELARKKVQEYLDQGKKIIVLDAAVLLEAGWDKMTNEVWVAVIPRGEAVKRIMDRNKLSEEEAIKRIDSQLTNDERVKNANVVLSSLWDYDVTQKQVEKAWELLMKRTQGPSKL